MAMIKDLLGADIDTGAVKKPSDLYRIMHPELFSDSHVEKDKIERDQFKYILSRLSTDMRQDAFEELTRRCIIKLITPNIIPQTGPTGGGDAKSDLITYPVSDNVSALWSVSEGCKGSEKWAFAVSIKDDWSPKMDSDVKKIIENIPDCTRIYFCTNQTVTARSRFQKQAKYKSDEWGNKETYIFDQNWYIQAIYDQGCYNDAIEALGLGDSLKEVKIVGPNDMEREKRLAEIESELPRILSDGVSDKYVADLLEAAMLVRSLERPVNEVRGRFCLALEAAKKYGFPQQVFECIYQRAWAEFHWFDNPDGTLEGYNSLKEMLDDEISVVRIEKLYNLYRLLVSASGQGLIKQAWNPQDEQKFFDSLFSTLSRNPLKPSCTLFLQICLLEDKLMQILYMKDDVILDRETAINEVLDQLIIAIPEAANHLDIGFDSQVEVMMGLGKLIGTNTRFDDLVDAIAEIQSKRSQDISAANIQYERGVQHLENENYDGAIRHLSRSYVLYHKENTLTRLVRTSVMLGKAYYEQDLLYNAKTCYCKALGLLFKSMGDDGRSDHLIVTILMELCFLELRLGQLTTFLEWLMLLDGIVAVIPEYLDDNFLLGRGRMDALLGARFFEAVLNKADFTILPDILSRHQLDFSRNVLLLKMGRKKDISNDYCFLLDSEDSTKSNILQLVEQERLLFPLTLNVNKTALLRTVAHGCTFEASFSGYTYNQTYSEMFLSFMELLMDGKTVKVFPTTSEIRFDVQCNTEGETKVERGKRNNEYHVIINKNTFTSQDNIWEVLIRMLSQVISGSVVVGDVKSFLTERQKDDYFMQRISLLSGYPADVSNFSSNVRKAYLEMFSKAGDSRYDFKLEKGDEDIKRDSKQNDAYVTSLIDVRLWDEAKWKGCGFWFTRDLSEPGILVFLFKNIAQGIQIFEKWEEDYNAGKLNIKIVIISGVDKAHPQWYKVLVTPDVKWEAQQGIKERYVVSTVRFHLMNARSDDNIKNLKVLYNKYSYIGLSAAAIVGDQMSLDRDKRYNRVIPVRNVSFIEAWTIKEDDIESIAILPDDNVIIPLGREKDAPVLNVIAKKKKYGKDED